MVEQHLRPPACTYERAPHFSTAERARGCMLRCGLVYVQGKARPDGSPRDIDKEFVLMYSIAHERKSFFALGNYLKFLPQLVNTLPKQRALVDELAGDDSYDYEDLYYMINGARRPVTQRAASARQH